MTSANSAGRQSLFGDAALSMAAERPVDESRPVELRVLFEAHYPFVFRVLRRLGVPSGSVDDAAQEVFWVAARRLSDIRRGSETAFLYAVALRVAATHHRRAKSLPVLAEPDLLAALEDLGPSPEQALEERRARALLDVALDRLPFELRSVFVLFELEGLSAKEIAELEDIPIGTASSRLRRAREEFSAIARRLRAELARSDARPPRSKP